MLLWVTKWGNAGETAINTDFTCADAAALGAYTPSVCLRLGQAETHLGILHGLSSPVGCGEVLTQAPLFGQRKIWEWKMWLMKTEELASSRSPSEVRVLSLDMFLQPIASLCLPPSYPCPVVFFRGLILCHREKLVCWKGKPTILIDSRSNEKLSKDYLYSRR